MAKFYVEVAEVWKRTFEIEIPDETPRPNTTAELLREKANEKSEAGDDDQGFEYSHTLELEHWTVRAENGDFVS